MGVFFITLITFFHVIFLWYMYLSLNYWNGRYLIHASLRHHLTYFQLNSSNHCHHCPKHSMVNGQFCCLWLFPCLRYVHVCNSFHWMAWKQRLNYEFRHTWWITGSRRYQKKYSPDKGIYEMYMQKPEKTSLSIHCATLFQNPLIIQGSLGGWMLYQHISYWAETWD